ncbi:MAG: hypothetical protein K2R98_31825 [Gemmataceae bacterium]|nr:hypothetical protein [Gemmataceae bacterium]
MFRFRPLIVLVLLIGAARGIAQGNDPDEPPLVGQPEDFNGAVGGSFQVSMRARPTELEVGEPLTLTIRINAVGTWKTPPRRPRIANLKAFKERFQIERIDKKKFDQPNRTPDRQTWEFDYQLRPLSESVKSVPSVPFVYYKPSNNSVVPGRYERTLADGIPLTVKPRVEKPAIPVAPIQAPAAVFQIAQGPSVLRHQSIARQPSAPMFAMLLLLPPAVCLGIVAFWRRLYPDAARRVRIRQSQAARHALHALQALGPVSLDQRAYRVAHIAAGYLQQRLGMPGVEPTPAEVALFLRQRAGAPDALAGKAAEFFRACDAARFAPASSTGADELAATAKGLILSLETESWSAQAS